ncbi:MAG: [protein-PII] uridylyltransferase [Acidobacteriota bacterium]|nr:[protein-PII] uridylyltransferase [Acidobacteriota bacterium]
MSSQAADYTLRSFYQQEFARLRGEFEASGSSEGAIKGRTRLVDKLAVDLWNQHVAPRVDSGLALVALGGFGRQALFPYSDIDLLFLTGNEALAGKFKDPVRSICQEMWDIGLRVSPTTRTLENCSRFDQDNVEFAISLLDSRFLAGDAGLVERLRGKNLPQLLTRECDALVQRLTEVTRTRHLRFGDTIFHLEPNLKDGPGGLRDFQISRWLAIIASVSAGGAWTDSPVYEHNSENDEVLAAVDFLAAARCHLHYRANRDENVIHWEAQEELAARGVASRTGAVSSAEWMRMYFRCARVVHRNTTRLLDQVPRNRSSLYRSFQRWRSRFSNEEFSVVDGNVFLQQAVGARDASVVLRLFTFLARHGLALSLETERRIRNARRGLTESMPQDSRLWEHLREILALPHAAEALRAMHSLNLLTLAIPEFETIDSLVLRDLYHRYTVDEHTFLAIEVLHRLKDNDLEWLQPFGELLTELERPELLFLALLLHDTGKGLEGTDHVHNSLQLAAAAADRMDLPAEDAQTVCFLIASHLEMSSTMRRRDIYDPETVRELANKLGTTERLKMLTLLTLADIKAVNPEALTPWKAENLWRLYAGTANYFSRSVDQERFHAEVCSEQVERVAALLPKRRSQLLKFLDGLPQRYLMSHSPEQVILHFEMANQLRSEPVQLGVRRVSGQNELTVVTDDRPGLFATLAGILYGWGMDITKASAFSNRAGVIVDSFYFRDRFRTLELNPPERERFNRSIIQILGREASLDSLLESRLKADTKPVKLKVETRLRYDNDASPGSTLLEVITQDRHGLLHAISSTLASEGCSIEVALIDTEGAVAHDVFYLTFGGIKLTREQQRSIEWALTTELSDSLPSSW